MSGTTLTRVTVSSHGHFCRARTSAVSESLTEERLEALRQRQVRRGDTGRRFDNWANYNTWTSRIPHVHTLKIPKYAPIIPALCLHKYTADYSQNYAAVIAASLLQPATVDASLGGPTPESISLKARGSFGVANIYVMWLQSLHPWPWCIIGSLGGHSTPRSGLPLESRDCCDMHSASFVHRAF